MPNTSIVVNYDLMDEHTADPMYLEYLTCRKYQLHYAVISREDELAVCITNNHKAEDAIRTQIATIDKVQYNGDTEGTAPFKTMLYRLEELKRVKSNSAPIMNETALLVKSLKAALAEIELEVDYNERLVDEAEADQMKEYDDQINEEQAITRTPPPRSNQRR
ncbi:uncharacterized protein LAJ45_03573 [Morchella importuna]|uniref:uncharacterized protein n=1 Tax=Morchella importuna TaxID=1174673 RepID=UPI001E8D199C|nr:uncharacterized protein LAJ45_03573 [Morchella importuna]KAH8152147.1 hypothetical protein LAJ45_03573 [Morchella importuna]